MYRGRVTGHQGQGRSSTAQGKRVAEWGLHLKVVGWGDFGQDELCPSDQSWQDTQGRERAVVGGMYTG